MSKMNHHQLKFCFVVASVLLVFESDLASCKSALEWQDAAATDGQEFDSELIPHQVEKVLYAEARQAEIRAKVRQFREHHLEDFKAVHQLDFDLASLRQKRDVSAGNGLQYHGQEAVWVLESVERIANPFETSGSESYSDCRITWYQKQRLGSCLVTDGGETRGVFYQVSEDWKFSEIGEIEAHSCKQLLVYKNRGNLYAVTVSDGEFEEDVVVAGGSTVYKIEFRNASSTFDDEALPGKLEFSEIQTIETPHVNFISVREMSAMEAVDTIMFVVPDREIREISGSRRAFFNVNIKCYRWQGGYVDFVYSIPAKSPQAISHASIASRDYIFVANYRDDSGSTRIFSSIWSYNYNNQKFQRVQNIQTYGARDSEFFKFIQFDGREEHFLVVANEGSDVIGNIDAGARTHIYKRASNNFVLFQVLSTFGAWKVNIMQHDGKFVMAIMEHGGAMSFYQYTGWKFAKVSQISFEHRDSEDPFFLHPFRVNQDLFFSCITGDSEQNGLYRIEMERRKDYEVLSQDLQNWCTKAESTVRPEEVLELIDKLKALPKVTDTELVMKRDVEFTSKLEVRLLKTEALIVQGGNTFDMDMEGRLEMLEDKLQNLGIKTAEMLDRVNSAVSTTSSGQKVLTPLKFRKWQMEANDSALNVTYLVADNVNGQNLDVLKQVVFSDADYHMSFVKADKLTTSDMNINAAQINRKPVGDIVLRKSAEDILMLGNNSFTGGFRVESSMSANRKWNEVERLEFVSRTKAQKFKQARVSSGTIRNLSTRLLNDVDIDSLNEDAILKNENGIVSGPKSFQRVKCGNIEVGAIGSYDVNHILQNSIRLSEFENSSAIVPGNVTWNLKLEDLFCDTVFLHDDKINGEYDLEEDFIAVNSPNGQSFIGTLELEASETNFGNLIATRSFNEIPVSHTDKTLAVLQKSSKSPQKLQNTKLNTLILSEPSTMEGSLNSRTVEDLLGSRIIQLQTTSASRIYCGSYDVMFTEPILAEEMFVGDDDLLATLEQLASANLTMSHTCNPEKIVFDSVVVQGDLQAVVVNGLTDLVLKSDPSATITAPKEFAGQLSLQEVEAGKLLSSSGWDMLPQMDKILLIWQDQTFKAVPAFEGGLRVESLLVEPTDASLRLDGIPFDSIILANRDGQEVNVDTKCDSLVVSGVSQVTEQLHVTEWNDQDLDEIMEDTLRTETESGHQVVTGYYTFKQTLALHDVNAATINTYTVEDLFMPLIPNTQHAAGLQSTINGTLVLKNSAAISDLVVSTFINNLDVDHWGLAWLTREGKQDVSTPFVFHKKAQAKGPEVVDHLVSDVNVRTLNETTLRKHDDMDCQQLNIANSTKFPSHFCRKAGGVAGRSLDDADIEFLPIDKRWDISEPLSSEQEAKYKLYKKFIEDASDVDKSVALMVKGRCSFAREPQEVARVNDISIEDAMKRFWFADESTLITTPIDFDSASFIHSDVEGLMCGVDLEDFDSSYLSKSRDQTWTGQFTFDNELEANKLTVTDTVLLEGKCNEFDPEEVMQKCLLQDEEQTINTPLELETLYAPNVNVSMLNDFDWCSEFATVDGTNRITGPKRVLGFSAQKLILPEDAVVDGVNLVEWEKEAAKVKGDFVIRESRSFQNATFKHMELETMNGKALDSTEVLLNQGDQKGGNLTISSSDPEKPTEFSEVQVNNNLNGQKVEVRMGKIVMDNGRTPLYMMGKKFKKKVRAANVTSRAKLTQQETEVNQLLKMIESPTKIVHNYSALGEKLARLLDVFDEYIEVASEHAAESQCFNENFQMKILGLAAIFPVNFESTPALGMLSDGGTGQTISWYNYDKEGRKYLKSDTRPLNLRSKLEDFTLIQRRKKLYLVASCNSLDGDIVPLPVRFCPGCTNVNLGSLESGNPHRTFVITAEEHEPGNVQFGVRHLIAGSWLVNSFEITTAERVQRHCLMIIPSRAELAESSATIYCFLPTNTHSDDDDDGLHHYQDLQTGPAKHVVSISGHSEVLLLVATEVSEPAMLPETQKISVWSNFQGSAQFKLQDTLHVSNLRSMDGILASNYHYFLAVAVGASGQVQSGRVMIYRYSEPLRVFQKYQTLEVGDPTQVKFQNLEPTGEQLLYILSDRKLKVYSFKGAAQWTLVHTLETPKASSFSLNTFSQAQIYAAHALVIEDDHNVRGFSMQFNGIPHVS